MNDTVLHFSIIEHQDHQHAIFIQTHELYVAQVHLIAQWRCDQTSHLCDLQHHVRGTGNQISR